jgi:hypothetical protein
MLLHKLLILSSLLVLGCANKHIRVSESCLPLPGQDWECVDQNHVRRTKAHAELQNHVAFPLSDVESCILPSEK